MSVTSEVYDHQCSRDLNCGPDVHRILCFARFLMANSQIPAYDWTTHDFAK